MVIYKVVAYEGSHLQEVATMRELTVTIHVKY